MTQPVRDVTNDEEIDATADIPLEHSREIESETETAYLLSSEVMKTRLLEAKARTGGLSLEDARAKPGL